MHARLLRDSPGSDVGDCLGSPQDFEAKNIEPIVIDGCDGLRHESLALPRQPQPVATVVKLILVKADLSDEALGRFLQAQAPMPLFTSLHRRQDDIAILPQSQTFGPRPRNHGVKKFDNFPLGKEAFRFRRIGKLKRTQEKALRFEWDDHPPYNSKGPSAAHTVKVESWQSYSHHQALHEYQDRRRTEKCDFGMIEDKSAFVDNKFALFSVQIPKVRYVLFTFVEREDNAAQCPSFT